MTARARIAAGLALGVVAGGWDAVAIRFANPASFAGVTDTARFLLGATALGTLLGGAAGVLLAVLPRRLATAAIAILPGLCLFAWLGVRVHVRWFFGVPLSHPPYLAVNVALLVGTLGLSILAARAVGGRVGRWLGGRAVPAAAAAVALVAAIVLRAEPPHAGRPAADVTPPPAARDLLLVTLDTTRADHLGAYGYPLGTSPAFDRLARRALVFTEMIAPIPLTNPSHSSLFTGEIPRRHGVRNNGTPLGPDTPTFVDDLSASGWHCGAFVSGIPLKASLSGLSRAFARYDDRFSALERAHPMMTSLAVVRVAQRVLPIDVVERRAVDTGRAAERWLRESDRPRFAWVHFFDAHTPYDARPVRRHAFAAGAGAWSAQGTPAGAWPNADYDAEIATADRALSSLLRTFDEATGGRGVVVVTADHGEGLGQHGELAHGAQLYAEDLHVPCVAAGDGIGPGWRTGMASSTELAALVPEWAGLDGPEDVEAGSFLMTETFAPEGKQDQSAIWHESGRKLMMNWETGEELAFDRAADPGETGPLPPGDAFTELREHLVPPTRAEVEALDPETVRRLRALGYLH